MSWFSILPEDYEYIETWVIRIFILLGVLSIGPWALLIIYDLVLYIFRTTTYELPFVGGRYRNQPRPRAPSLVNRERPNGKPRGFSLIVPGIPTAVDPAEENMKGLKRRSERTGHERSGSGNALVGGE